QVPAMMQTLLAERFGLQIHRESREFQVLALVVGKGGAHLKESAEDNESTPSPQIRGGVAGAAGGAAAFTGRGWDRRVTPGAGGNEHVEAKKTTMAGLANFLGRYVDRPLVEMTGLKGAYDMELDVSGEEIRNAARSHGYAMARGEAA